MPISIACTECQTAYQLPDTMRGQTFHCDRCRAPIVVPGPEGLIPAPANSSWPRAEGDASPIDALRPLRDVRLHKRGPMIAILVTLATVGVILMSCMGLSIYWLISFRVSSPPTTPLAILPPDTAPATKLVEPTKLAKENPSTAPRKGVVTWANYEQMLFDISEARVRALLGPPTKSEVNPATPHIHTDTWEENGFMIRLGIVDGRLGSKYTTLKAGPSDKPFELVTKERYDKIMPDMSLDDVKDILGLFKNSHGNVRTMIFTCEWIDPVTQRTITLVVKNSKVKAKRSSMPEWGGFEEGNP